MIEYERRPLDASALRRMLIAAGLIVPRGDYVPIACEYAGPVLRMLGTEDCSAVPDGRGGFRGWRHE